MPTVQSQATQTAETNPATGLSPNQPRTGDAPNVYLDLAALDDKTVLVVVKKNGVVAATPVPEKILTTKWHSPWMRYGMPALVGIIGATGGAAGGYYFGKKKGIESAAMHDDHAGTGQV